MDMYEIPIFPLNTVLFPGMPLHLHIFEERYKVMMQYVLAGDRRLGIVLIKNGLEAFGPLALPHKIGCTARVTHVDHLKDGRMNLTAIGENRFQILTLSQDRPYLYGSVENIPLDQPISLEVERKIILLRASLKAYLKLISEVNNSSESGPDQIEFLQLDLPEDANSLLFMACAILQIPAAEKQPILELLSSIEIVSYLVRIYKRELSVNRALQKTSDEASRRSSLLN